VSVLRLLTGGLTDREYFRSLEASRYGLFYMPKPGWRARRERIVAVLAEVACGLVLLLTVLACCLAGPVPR